MNTDNRTITAKVVEVNLSQIPISATVYVNVPTDSLLYGPYLYDGTLKSLDAENEQGATYWMIEAEWQLWQVSATQMYNKTKASEYQPPPQKGNVIVVDAVLSDIRERAETGKAKYGTYLETHNGRNALWDAYQEAIDLVMYLRQALLEQEAAPSDPFSQ